MDRDFYTISKSNGDAVRVDTSGVQEGYQAATYRTTNTRVYAAMANKIYEFTAAGEQRQSITLSPGTTDIKGMTFIGPNLYFVDDDTNKVYKGSIPHGINVTTDPLAQAANGTSTVYILVDGTPRDKILVVNPANGTTTSSYDAPDDQGEGITYLGGSLYYASNKDNQRRIYKLNAATGAEESNFFPQNQWGDQIWESLQGLGNDGADLILSTNHNWDPCLEKINTTTGANEGRLCDDQNWDTGMKQAKGVAVAPDGFILAAKNDELVQLNPEGDSARNWVGLRSSLADIEGLAFVGGTLYLADDQNNKVYKTTVPSGIQVTTDPLALAYGTANSTTTLFILADATPRDKILLVAPDDGSLAAAYDAPDDNGEGLTYLNGSLYYASNKDSNRRIYQLNPDTGAQLSNFNPQDQWGNNIWESLQGLGNDGSDLILSTNNPWDPCLEKIDSTTGSNQGRLCADSNEGIVQAKGVSVTSDGFIVASKNGDIFQLTSEGKENASWLNLAGVTDIQGLTFVSSTLYIADDGGNTIYKTTVASGIQVTTDPLALAYGTANSTTTLFILVDATPVDKVLLADPDDGSLLGHYDAPDNQGGGLTYMGTSLYYAGRGDNDSAKIYELNPDTGVVLGSIIPRWDWGGEIFDAPRSLSNDGVDLLLYFGNMDCMQRINNVTGDSEGQLCPEFFGDGLIGARGLAVSSDGSLFSAKNMDVTQLTTLGQKNLIEVGRWATSTADYEGLTFVSEVLYLADDASNSIYKASKPSGITNNPQGMAYDGTNLYILVDGGLSDHILVINPTSGAVVADFAAPDRDSHGITHLVTQTTSTLFVLATRQEHWGNQHLVYRVSPTDGSQLDTPIEVFVDSWVNEWRGLTNDGSWLILAPDTEGFVILLDPDTGNFERRIDFYGSPFFGFDAIAYHASPKDLLATNGGEVIQIDEDGRLLQSFSTSLNQLRGAAIIGNALYLADGQSKTIQIAAIPAPPSTIGTSPKGMATDGTRLYLVVDGSPKDRILVLGTGPGQLINSYEAPGDNTNGLAWHNGQLYAVTNEFHPKDGDQPARVHVVDPDTGQVVQWFDISAPWGGLLHEQINSLASDGTYLYAGSRWNPEWFRIDPTSPNTPAVHIWAEGDFMWTHYVGSLELAEVAGIPTTLLSSGYSDSGQVITRFEPDTGFVTDQFNLGANISVEGMAYIDTVLYLADASSDSILSTTLPDNIPEITTVGDYQAILRVVSGATTQESNPPTEFSLARNTDVQTEITAPLDNFATTTAVIPIQGRVSDPSIHNVTVGVVLPFTSLLEDDVTQATSPALWNADGLWHIDCSDAWNPPVNSSPPCAWRYGEVNQPGYGQGVVSQGSLTTKDPITVGPGTRLRFDTWYATEPVPDVDLKLVEVAVVTTDKDGNDIVGNYQALLQVVGFGFFDAPMPFDDNGTPLFDLHDSFERWEIEQEWVEFMGSQPSPRFETIEKSLHPFIGNRVMIRFRFDTVDDFANDAVGWFIDDIVIEGSGFKGQQTAVAPLDPPVTENSVTWYGTFDTIFELAEGSNQVVARAQQPYPPKPHGPNLTGVDFVLGFLDLTGHAMALGGIPDIVATPSQTLTGTIEDINFTSMVITQTYVVGNETQEKTVYAITELPGDGTFSVPVSLLEGTNTFKATALDGSLNQSQETFVAELDTVGPVLTSLSTSYPLGATSARAGDLVVFQVDASDALGIQRVIITLPGDETVDMVPSSEIPEAVLDQWSVIGGWVLPLEIPPATPPGSFELPVTAFDNAGNQLSSVVLANVVPTLEGFTFNLMPGQNLISLPLTPDVSDIVQLLGTQLLSAIDTIMYYDASLTHLPQEDRWLMFSPNAPADLQTLNELQTGRGYWFKMKDAAFTFSAPLAPGLPQTPRPIVFSYSGEFLQPGAVPPTYPVAPGWNLIGFHSEHPLTVTISLQSLESPQRVWASLFGYDNVIRFELDDEPEIILGGFSRVLPTGEMEPGKGYWVFMVDSGIIVP